MLVSCSVPEPTAVTLQVGFLSPWLRGLSGTSVVRGRIGDSCCFYNHSENVLVTQSLKYTLNIGDPSGWSSKVQT